MEAVSGDRSIAQRLISPQSMHGENPLAEATYEPPQKSVHSIAFYFSFLPESVGERAFIGHIEKPFKITENIRYCAVSNAINHNMW